MAGSSKERILSRIRSALSRQDPIPFPGEDLDGPIYVADHAELDLLFAQRFKAVGGDFVYCESEAEFVESLRGLTEQKGWRNLHCWDEKLQQLFASADFRECRIGRKLDKADAGIARCESLIARTGGILLSSRLAAGRSLPIYPPVQIVVASPRQLVYDIADGLGLVRETYQGDLPSMINLATGPSRTADIEKTLVLGAHGPGEVYVFLVEDR